jgi:hypothetical protein
MTYPGIQGWFNTQKSVITTWHEFNIALENLKREIIHKKETKGWVPSDLGG